MKSLMKLYDGVLLLALFVDLVSTPEQRAQWQRDADWDRYASKFSD